jgi:hypothetical protein
MSYLYGLNSDNGKYRFLIDEVNEKIRLFKKVDNELIPIKVWHFTQLINEMMCTDDN